MKGTRLYLTATVLLVLAVPLCAVARETGSDDAKCGDPSSNETCNKNACHTTYPLNSGDGLLTLNNVPVRYDPGATYSIEVMISDAGMNRWGFQVTALDGSNLMAGSFTVTDAVNTWLSDNPGTTPDYVNHTLAGTYGGTPDGPVYWDFDWTAPSTAVGTVRFYLGGCASDSNVSRSGDYIYTYTQDVMQANHDVAVVTLDTPPDSMCVDTLYPVQATLRNNGEVNEVFSALATIDPSGYADTIQVSLVVGQTSQVAFAPWRCPGMPDNYTLTVTALLTGDVTPGDNTASKQMDSYYCAIHDASAIAIVVPGDSICAGSTYPPRALVVNLGNVMENIYASCIIDPSGYSDTTLVRTVAPAETAYAVFKNWTVPAPLDTYAVVVRTLLSNDMFTSNDSTGKQSVSHDCTNHDVGVLSVLNPPWEPCTDSTYTPAVAVVNYGNATEGFGVFLTISPGYSEAFSVSSLLPGDTAIATFADWTAPADPATFQLTAYATVPDDADPGNDTVAGPLDVDSCFVVDLATLDILSPDWWVCTDSTYPVAARFANHGDGSNSFWVKFEIGLVDFPQYKDSVRVNNLASGETLDVDFKDWNTPSVPDTMTVRAFVILSVPDIDPGNDLVFDTTFVYNCPGVAESMHRTGPLKPSGLVTVFPNPARRSVHFSYNLDEEQRVRLDILDISGRTVRTVIDGTASAGSGSAVWDLDTGTGSRAATGVYFARLFAGESVSLRKFVVVR